MLITELKMTCNACPTQYEGIISNGECIYIRYRWGGLTIGVGGTIDEAVRNVIVHTELGDQLDGYITYDDLKRELLKHDILICLSSV